MTASRIDQVREAIATNPTFDGGDRDLVLRVYNALADGEEITQATLAQGLGRPEEDVQATLARCNLEYDGEQIVGFGGLSRLPTAHKFHVRGSTLYTWCAWDPLFIAPILGEDARVESVCPDTGQVVTMVVAPTGVREIDPRSAVLSMRIPDESCTADVQANFCSVVNLFASVDAAERWRTEHTGTFIITVDEAFELGRLLVQQRAGQGETG
jgi:alkylmercury lyase